MIISKGFVLNVSLPELHPNVSTKGGLDRTRSEKLATPENLHNILETTERAQILCALEIAHGVVMGPDGAAARLRLKRSTLRFKMQKFAIHVSRTAVEDRN